MIQGDPIEVNDLPSHPRTDGATALDHSPGSHPQDTRDAQQDERIGKEHGSSSSESDESKAGAENSDASAGISSRSEDLREVKTAPDASEDAHDAAWVETESNLSDLEDKMAEATARLDAMADTQVDAGRDLSGDLQATLDTESPTIVMNAPSRTERNSDTEVDGVEALKIAEDAADMVANEEKATPVALPPEQPAPSSPASDVREKADKAAPRDAEIAGLGLQAINALGERIEATEKKYEGALDRISHAIGVIAERIDGIETRNSERTIEDITMVTSPHREESNVAPYIANAERELEAKKESGPLDIFDRIARAAETEFDSARHTGAAQSVVEDIGDSRRVGTKKWTPSKTLKRRMQQLGEVQDAADSKTPTIATVKSAETIAPKAERPLQKAVTETTKAPPATDFYLAEDGEKRPERRQPKPAADRGLAEHPVQTKPSTPEVKRSEPAIETDELGFDDDFDHDDPGLSVVPGARGRRRDRARKSRLDEDFETVFGDEEVPSISRLRRKMRDTKPEDEAETEAAPAEKTAFGGLSSLLGGKKKKKAPEPVDSDDDDALMAAFESGAENASNDDDDEDVLEDLIDDSEVGPSKVKFLGSPIVYIGIAAVACIAFVLAYLFMQ